MGSRSSTPLVLVSDGVIELLPLETLVKISSQLTPIEVMSFARSSQKLYKYVHESYALWNFLLQRDFEVSAKSIAV